MDLFNQPYAIFLLVFMVIAAIKSLLDAAKAKQGGENERNREESVTDLYEETRQQIVERQRTQSPPPQPQQPAAPQQKPMSILDLIVPHTRQPATPPPPPVPATPPPVPQSAPKPLSPYAKAKKPTLSAAEQAALARVQKRGMTGKSQSTVRRTPVKQMLSSPAATRDAIVLREILGPPKGDF